MDLAESGTLAVIFLASGEVSFYGAAALLGKEFLAAMKKKFASWFRRTAAPPKPVSRARHQAGVLLLALSFLPYYFALIYLVFFVPENATLHVLAWSLVAGEALGIGSLFVLGGQFWDRLKRLFQWQDEERRRPARKPLEAPDVSAWAGGGRPPRPNGHDGLLEGDRYAQGRTLPAGVLHPHAQQIITG